VDSAKNTHKHTFKQLARIRRGCLKILDLQLFTKQEIPAATVHDAASTGSDLGYECVFARKHGSHIQYYRVPDRELEVFRSMELVLALIDRSALKIILGNEQSAKEKRQADEMGHDLLTIGMHAASLGIKIDHKERSRPKKQSNAKLTDPEDHKFAEDEIRRHLRAGSKVSFSAACDRAAAVLLRDRGIQIGGRALRNKFPNLKPASFT